MRIWSIHPKYLDAKGLVALWRETLLAQNVLLGKTKGYKNHPQLNRFKAQSVPPQFIGSYLSCVYDEALRRGYSFDATKIIRKLPSTSKAKIKVHRDQVKFEFEHLKKKLKLRSPRDFTRLMSVSRIEVHPLFRTVPGKIEDWEIITTQASGSTSRSPSAPRGPK
jgi:hypothetical protein